MGIRIDEIVGIKKKEIIDRYYKAYETLVRENPVGHGMDYVHV